jgi:RPA family protein
MRKVAYKLWIKNINEGNPIIEDSKLIGVEVNGTIISRVNIIASVVDKFVGNNFVILTLDDSTGIIEVRDFEDFLEDIEIGDTILVIGTLRIWNEKLYILKEIIKKISPLYLVARKLELEKLYNLKRETKKTNTQIVLEKIKEIEEREGEVDIEKLYLELDLPKEEIKDILSQLLENMKIYEPRPGIIKLF